MTRISDFNARAAGLPDCRKEDYAAFLAIMEDADGLPASWDEFQRFTNEAEHRFKLDGYIVVRVYIDPETFPDWCRANGVGVDSKGRIKFAASVAASQHGSTH